MSKNMHIEYRLAQEHWDQKKKARETTYILEKKERPKEQPSVIYYDSSKEGCFENCITKTIEFLCGGCISFIVIAPDVVVRLCCGCIVDAQGDLE